MLPEAGGSSSFTRRAFNEFVSFGAGWALMLDYIVTIAISAFFVPNYLAVFWPVLKTWPYNSIGGIVVILALVVINVDRDQGGGAPQHRPRRRRPRHPGPHHDHRRRAAARAAPAHRPGGPLDGADPAPVRLRDLHRHDRLHGHRDDLEHGGGGGEPRSRRAARHQHGARHGHRRVHRHVARRALRHAGGQQRAARRPAHGLSSRRSRSSRARSKAPTCSPTTPRQTAYLPVETIGGRTLMPAAETKPTGEVYTRDGVEYTQAVRHAAGQQLHRRPGAGSGALHPGRPRLAARHPRHLGRRPRGDHPRHRHERRPDRRVAARLLAGPAPPGAADPRPRAPQAH